MAENYEKYGLELAQNQNACEGNLDSTNADIKQLNLTDVEELLRSSEACRELLEAQVMSLTMSIEEKNEALQGKGNALEKLTNDCEQHLDIMESCKQPYIDRITELKGVVTMQENLIEKLSHSLEEAREDKRKLEEEQLGRGLLWQQEKDDYQSKVRGLQNDIDGLLLDHNALQLMFLDSSPRMSEMAGQLCAEKLDSHKQDFGSECVQVEVNLTCLDAVKNVASVEGPSKFEGGM